MLPDTSVDARREPSWPPDLIAVADAIRAAWSHRTSAHADWTSALASSGQCAVTALMIQELFGGDLLRAVVDGESHYWNQFSDGSEFDLTRDQFKQFSIDGDVVVRDRAYVVSYPETAARYDLLRTAVLEALDFCS